MIANISKGGFLQPLLDYNDKKVNKKEATLLSVENTITNSYGNNGYENAKNRIAHLGYSSKRKDKFFHVSLNFHEKDTSKLNDNVLKSIAKEYMNKMGFDTMPFIVYKHEDTNHPHIHIVASNINEEGKVISASNDRKISQRITRELEIKHDLTIVPSEKNKYEQKEITLTEFSSLKAELNYTLKNALHKYKAQSFTDLQKYMNLKNLDIQLLKGVTAVNGVDSEYNGIVFNKFETNFKQQQKGIKGSALYLKPTLKNLEKTFERNTVYHKENRKKIRNQIDYILSPYNKITIDNLQKKLSLKGIELQHKYDSQYNLVGISFVDFKTGYKYTGEQIGKNYTAKNIAQYIGSKNEIRPNIITTLNYNRFSKNLDHLNINQQIHSLIALGFKVQFQDNSISISDYKNNPGEGYVKIHGSVNLNPSIIDLYKSSKNIKFNNLTDENKLHFEYNRAVFENNFEKIAVTIGKLEGNTSPNSKNNNDVKEYLDNLYKDVYSYQSDDSSDDNTVADIDKNKRKKPKRKR